MYTNFEQNNGPWRIGWNHNYLYSTKSMGNKIETLSLLISIEYKTSLVEPER